MAGLLRRAPLLATPAHATGLLPLTLPELDTAELAEAAEIKRRLAQQMTYCLQAMGCSTLWASGAARSSMGRRRGAPAARALPY